MSIDVQDDICHEVQGANDVEAPVNTKLLRLISWILVSISRLLLFDITRSSPIPAVSAAPRFIRSMSAAAYIAASNGNIRKSICRLENRLISRPYADRMLSYIVRRSSLRSGPFGSSVESNVRSLELALASASTEVGCMTAGWGENSNEVACDGLIHLIFLDTPPWINTGKSYPSIYGADDKWIQSKPSLKALIFPLWIFFLH